MSLDPLTAGIDLVSTIFNKFIPDKDLAAKAAAEYQVALLAADQANLQAQNDVNKVEASNASVFVSGWRPFVGWVCGAGLAWAFVLAPIATWTATVSGAKVTFPAVDTATLTQLLLAMLGMAGIRSFDKLKSIASK